MGKDKLLPNIKKIQKKIKRQSEEIEKLLREKQTAIGQRKLDRLSEFYQMYLGKLEPYLDLVAPGLLKKMESEIMTIIQTNESPARKINRLRQFDEKYRNKITKGLFKDEDTLRTLYEDLSRVTLPRPYESDLAGFFSPSGMSWAGEHRQNFFSDTRFEEADPEEAVNCLAQGMRFAPPFFASRQGISGGISRVNVETGEMSTTFDQMFVPVPSAINYTPPIAQLGLTQMFAKEDLEDPIYESFVWDVVYEVLVGIEVLDAEITGFVNSGAISLELGARLLVFEDPDIQQGLQCEEYKTIKRVDGSSFLGLSIGTGPHWDPRFIRLKCHFVPKPDTQYQVRVLAETEVEISAPFALCHLTQTLAVRCIVFQIVPAYLLIGG